MKYEKLRIESWNYLFSANSIKRVSQPARGRELLDALKDIEDHFIRAYDSVNDVSKMLEASRVHMLSGLEEIKTFSLILHGSFIPPHLSLSSVPFLILLSRTQFFKNTNQSFKTQFPFCFPFIRLVIFQSKLYPLVSIDRLMVCLFVFF